MKKQEEGKKLLKIKSNAFDRGLSLLGMTIGSSARYAGLKWGDAFVSKEKREERLKQYIDSQTQILVEEIGKLKGSIMKAGQMLSVYGEHFFPPEVNKILKSLQSNSPPIEWNEMHAVLKRQLGEEVLTKIDINTTPVAAASMGQVYEAKIISSGEKCALKVQYPGVDKAINSDLKALKSILSLSQLIPKGPRFDDLFKEIRMMLTHETDYNRELEMMEQYREWLKDDERFVIPKIYREFSSKRVLCMSFESGDAVDSLEVKNVSSQRRTALAAAFMDLMFKEIFEWRTVQTDPHFGNYKILLGDKNKIDKIILLDFGAVRKFSKKYILPFSEMVRSSLDADKEKTLHAGQKLGFLRAEDSEEVNNLFCQICFTGVEGFEEIYESPSLDGSSVGGNPYKWGDTDIISKLTKLAKNAVFAFRLRPPPREAIFLDRKMVGTYTIVSMLKMRMGPRRLLLKYVDQVLHEK